MSYFCCTFVKSNDECMEYEHCPMAEVRRRRASREKPHAWSVSEHSWGTTKPYVKSTSERLWHIILCRPRHMILVLNAGKITCLNLSEVDFRGVS